MPQVSSDRLDSAAERRQHPRQIAEELVVTLRLRGRLGALRVQTIDFNRYGLAVLIDKPLAKDQTVFVKIRGEAAAVEQLVGVVHNCRRHESECGTRYRCGIRFRPQSPAQLDRRQTEQVLRKLESMVERSAAAEDPAPPRRD